MRNFELKLPSPDNDTDPILLTVPEAGSYELDMTTVYRFYEWMRDRYALLDIRDYIESCEAGNEKTPVPRFWMREHILDILDEYNGIHDNGNPIVPDIRDAAIIVWNREANA